jgi:endonuclease VIII
MPEGDTIFRTAATMRRAIAGQPIIAFEAPRMSGTGLPIGGTITDVTARGKHLLVHVDGEPPLSLRTHMKMTGTWHLYRPDQPWRRARHRARVVITTPVAVAVCFDAPVVEIIRTERLASHPELRRLGPDLSLPTADLDEAVRRLSAFSAPDRQIGVALLDQRIACGVGNVFKSEALFACGLDPFAPLRALGQAERRELIITAAEQLRENLDGYPRRTVPEGLAVYGRAGSPCRRCGTPIVMARQGEQVRLTYWCPTCQPPHPDSGPGPDAEDPLTDR